MRVFKHVDMYPKANQRACLFEWKVRAFMDTYKFMDNNRLHR